MLLTDRGKEEGLLLDGKTGLLDGSCCATRGQQPDAELMEACR